MDNWIPDKKTQSALKDKGRGASKVRKLNKK